MGKGKPFGKPFEKGNGLQRSHGAYSLDMSGPSALDPVGISRLSDLRAAVRENSGRLELRFELAARLGLIAEIIFSELLRHKEENPNASILDAGVTHRGLSWLAEYRRALAELPAHEELEDITDYLQGDK